MSLNPHTYIKWFLRHTVAGLFQSSPKVKGFDSDEFAPVPQAVPDQKLLKSSVETLNAELQRAFVRELASDGLFSRCPGKAGIVNESDARKGGLVGKGTGIDQIRRSLS